MKRRINYIRELLQSNVEISLSVKREIAEMYRCKVSAVTNEVYYLTHPVDRSKYSDKMKIAVENSRARKHGADGQLEFEDWKSMCDRFGNKCLCCNEKKPLVIDHVVPISKGGSNTIDNIQPLCASCNSKKKDKNIDYRKASK